MLVATASTPAILVGGGGMDISVGPMATVINVFLVTKLLGNHSLHSPFIAIPIVLALGSRDRADQRHHGRHPALPAGDRDAVHVLRPRRASTLDLAPEPVAAPTSGWTSDLASNVLGIPGAAVPDRGGDPRLGAAAAHAAAIRHLYAVGGERRGGVLGRRRRHRGADRSPTCSAASSPRSPASR